jgi:hypothetical protein
VVDIAWKDGKVVSANVTSITIKQIQVTGPGFVNFT